MLLMALVTTSTAGQTEHYGIQHTAVSYFCYNKKLSFSRDSAGRQ